MRCLAHWRCTKCPAAQSSCITAADASGSQQKQQLPSPIAAACTSSKHDTFQLVQWPSQWPSHAACHAMKCCLHQCTAVCRSNMLAQLEGIPTHYRDRCHVCRAQAASKWLFMLLALTLCMLAANVSTPGGHSLLAGTVGSCCCPSHQHTSGDTAAACCTSASNAADRPHMSAIHQSSSLTSATI